MWVSGPLTPGTRLLFRFLSVALLSTREQMFSRFAFSCVQPFLVFGFQYLQLLISLRATMIAMMTIRTTRMIRR